jgi:hypothetical protein
MQESGLSLKVVGAGVGRTGTYSLKLALNQLGFGPCYHMEEIILDMPNKLPHWQAIVAGDPDFETVYDGYRAAVDWPTASYYRELHAAYPEAKFILTHRSPENWVESFSETIYKLISNAGDAPEPMRPWLETTSAVIAKAGFRLGLDRDQLQAAFARHNADVEAAIPAEQLLVYQVKEGWEPLCDFLGVLLPDGPFPRTNDRSEFWDKVSAAA